MELRSMDIFNSYKSDWNLAIQDRSPAQGNYFKGKCVTFQRALQVPLVIGQCFGLMPVVGICESDGFKLRFSYCSWRFLYSIVSICLQFCLVVLCIINFIITDNSLGSNTSIIFHTMACLTSVSFLRIATKWPRLSMHIARTEASDPNIDVRLTRRCKLACFVILFLACVEHMLADLYGISWAIDCNPERNLYEAFVLQSFPWIFDHVPYNHFNGFVTQFLNLQCTFNWNFADVFVMCMSLYLTSRFEQVNRRIIAVKGKYLPASFWRTMREDYNRLSHLVRAVNDTVGVIVFISFANNLFFICLQLLHTLAEGFKTTLRCTIDGPDGRPFRGFEQSVYFAYSFMFLVVRWLGVSLTAARVHTASKAPAYSLYDVSSSSFCIEIQRFLEQIHGDTVALSGLQFFDIKRGLILSIAGTIVTYELVLMQFTGVTPTSPSPI